MRSVRAFVLLLAAVLAQTLTSAAQTQTVVVATPQNVTLTPNPDGTLEVQFVSSLSCGDAVCTLPDTVVIERNGTDFLSLQSGIDVSMSGDGMGIKTRLAPDQWKHGDCFRIRQSAPAPDGIAAHTLFSDYSSKVCAT